MYIIVAIIVVFIILQAIWNDYWAKKEERQKNELKQEILRVLDLGDISAQLKTYDDVVVVKSQQALHNYSDIKYFKDTGKFDLVKNVTENRKNIHNKLTSFLVKYNFPNQ